MGREECSARSPGTGSKSQPLCRVTACGRCCDVLPGSSLEDRRAHLPCCLGVEWGRPGLPPEAPAALPSPPGSLLGPDGRAGSGCHEAGAGVLAPSPALRPP